MRPIRACLLLSSLAVAGIAQAQSVVITKNDPKDDSSLTWNGITLYGIVDVGLQYQTHGMPISDYFPAGTDSIGQQEQQCLGHRGDAEQPVPVAPRTCGPGADRRRGLLGFVFRLETFFNPQSGNLSDGLKSLTLNNGKPLNRPVDGRRQQCRRPAVRRCRVCWASAPRPSAHSDLRPSRDSARRWHLQVRPDGRRAGLFAHRVLRHDRRRW